MKKTILKTNQNDPQIKAYKEAVERGKRSQHVVPAEGRWVVIGGGADRPINTFGTQEEAIDKAKSIARSSGASVYIHGIDGRIREREDYGSNLFSPKDTQTR